MSSAAPSSGPVTTIDEAIARMQQIDASLPRDDGIACFNRMYLEVTVGVQARMGQGFFADDAFMTSLDVIFANLYFEAVDASTGPSQDVPTAWEPLVSSRSRTGIFEIQFALAGMNTHINHDLPIALVRTCEATKTELEAGSHRDDYQKVDSLLDQSEQSVRQSFESGVVEGADRHAEAILDLVGNFSINTARDVAWDTAATLWRCRGIDGVENLLMDSLAHTVAMAGRGLLIAA